MERDGEVLFLGGVGEVSVAVHRDGLSLQPLRPELNSSCWASIGFQSKLETKINFSDVYAIELMDWGSLCGALNVGAVLRCDKNTEMHRFVVHGITRSRKSPSPWVLCEYVFGHKDSKTCQSWVEHLTLCISNEPARPKNLMVFVHPLCGKGRGIKNWEMVAPMFDQAKVRTKVIVTQRAGHAYDAIASLSDKELKSFDGVVAVGGDGLFNEILNGLLSLRHKTCYPPTPEELSYNGNHDQREGYMQNGITDGMPSSHAVNDMFSEISNKCDDHEPLLSTPQSTGMGISSMKTDDGPSNGDNIPSVSFPNDWFRLGIIPSGSTDAIVLSTTGERDPVTSALHIILGRRMLLDIAQVVRWKTSPSAEVLPTVCYAASFAGYGFYGEVIRESENYRWMGPVRYDFSGTMVFLKHRSYEAQVAYLETNVGKGTQPSKSSQKSADRLICRANCIVCNETSASVHNSEDEIAASSSTDSENMKWVWSKGRFLSVGAAIISCRNERAPDGLVADAHLSDGFLHLLLVRDCPRPFYLWHLTQFSKKGSDPLNFKFVEHHKTPAFTFISSHDESVWNLDGEIFQASEVSVQVCRGLVNLFASGPEV